MTPGASKKEGGHLARTVDGNFHHLQKQCREEQKGREEPKVAVLCLLCQHLPQIISCCLLDGRLCRKEDIMCRLLGWRAAETKHLLFLSHCCQRDSRKTYPALDCPLFGLFKMHLVVKSYKYQMHLLSSIQYNVEGFCINGL